MEASEADGPAAMDTANTPAQKDATSDLLNSFAHGLDSANMPKPTKKALKKATQVGGCEH